MERKSGRCWLPESNGSAVDGVPSLLLWLDCMEERLLRRTAAFSRMQRRTLVLPHEHYKGTRTKLVAADAASALEEEDASAAAAEEDEWWCVTNEAVFSACSSMA